MSKVFCNLLKVISGGFNLNIPLVVEVRRVQMEREGHQTEYINWEHYTKVLEAKAKKIKES